MDAFYLFEQDCFDICTLAKALSLVEVFFIDLTIVDICENIFAMLLQID